MAGSFSIFYINRGRFHKGLELGIFLGDSSIHLRPRPTPNFYDTKSFSNDWHCTLRRAPSLVKSTPGRGVPLRWKVITRH